MVKPKVFVNTKTGEMKTQIPVLEIGDYREATKIEEFAFENMNSYSDLTVRYERDDTDGMTLEEYIMQSIEYKQRAE